MDNNDLKKADVSNVSNVSLHLYKTTVSVRLSPLLWEDFKVFARRLGMTLSEAVSEALRNFMIEKRDEANITVVLNHDCRRRINVATKLELKLVKRDLSAALKALRDPRRSESAKNFLMNRLREILKKALRVYERTHDEELQRLLARADELI